MDLCHYAVSLHKLMWSPAFQKIWYWSLFQKKVFESLRVFFLLILAADVAFFRTAYHTPHFLHFSPAVALAIVIVLQESTVLAYKSI